MIKKYSLQPWIKLKLQKQYKNCQLCAVCDDFVAQCHIIMMLGISTQHMHLFGQFQLKNDNKNQNVIAYKSDMIQVSQRKYIIMYLPQNKLQSQCMKGVVDVLKDYSSVIISDMSYGCSKLKDKGNIETVKAMLTNDGRDLFLMSKAENKVQLIRRLQIPNRNIFQSQLIGCNQLIANLSKITKIYNKYVYKYDGFLQGEKNWNYIVDFIKLELAAEQWLEDKSIEYKKMKDNNSMIQIKEIKKINNELNEQFEQIISKGKCYKMVIQQIMNNIKIQNNNNKFNQFKQLSEKINKLKCQNHQQLNIQKNKIKQIILSKGLDKQYLQHFIIHQQIQIKQIQITSFTQQLSKLRQEFYQKQAILVQLDSKLKYCTQTIQTQQNQLKNIYQLKNNLHDKQMKIQIQKLAKKNLIKQLQQMSNRYKILQNQNISLNNQKSIYKLQRQKLLQNLQQITIQNICLSKQLENIKMQKQDLQQKLLQSLKYQNKAIRSIENEAEIKNRINRYQNYVNQLKRGLQYFRKSLIDKFNFILSQNYGQYQHLKETYQSALNQIKIMTIRNNQLNNQIQRQRMKMTYFQKIVMNSYHNSPIIQSNQQDALSSQRPPIQLI